MVNDILYYAYNDKYVEKEVKCLQILYTTLELHPSQEAKTPSLIAF